MEEAIITVHNLATHFTDCIQLKVPALDELDFYFLPTDSNTQMHIPEFVSFYF